MGPGLLRDGSGGTGIHQLADPLEGVMHGGVEVPFGGRGLGVVVRVEARPDGTAVFGLVTDVAARGRQDRTCFAVSHIGEPPFGFGIWLRIRHWDVPNSPGTSRIDPATPGPN